MIVREQLPIDQKEMMFERLDEIESEMKLYDIAKDGRDGFMKLIRERSEIQFRLGIG